MHAQTQPVGIDQAKTVEFADRAVHSIAAKADGSRQGHDAGTSIVLGEEQKGAEEGVLGSIHHAQRMDDY